MKHLPEVKIRCYKKYLSNIGIGNSGYFENFRKHCETFWRLQKIFEISWLLWNMCKDLLNVTKGFWNLMKYLKAFYGLQKICDITLKDVRTLLNLGSIFDTFWNVLGICKSFWHYKTFSKLFKSYQLLENWELSIK